MSGISTGSSEQAGVRREPVQYHTGSKSDSVSFSVHSSRHIPSSMSNSSRSQHTEQQPSYYCYALCRCLPTIITISFNDRVPSSGHLYRKMFPLLAHLAHAVKKAISARDLSNLKVRISTLAITTPTTSGHLYVLSIFLYAKKN